MRIDIYAPRLDVPFKSSSKGLTAKPALELIREQMTAEMLKKFGVTPVSKVSANLQPIRVNWFNFIEALKKRHLNLGHQIRVFELPLWQITPDVVGSTSQAADRIYIPHKMRENWWLDSRIHYYMQMVIPNVFSIDSHGWGASAASFPIQPDGNSESGVFEMLCDRIKINKSKFAQPGYRKPDLEQGYVFFPCQLPHDETIKYHSDVEVSDALRFTMEWVKDFNLSATGKINPRSIIVKGHPANPSSMAPLRKVFNEMLPEMNDRAHWIDNMSIHQLIAGARVVVTVNSGVGLEAILHGKSIFTFGRSDYDAVTQKCNGNLLTNKTAALEKSYRKINQADMINYRKFVDAWYNTHYDYRNLKTFDKIF